MVVHKFNKENGKEEGDRRAEVNAEPKAPGAKEDEPLWQHRTHKLIIRIFGKTFLLFFFWREEYG